MADEDLLAGFTGPDDAMAVNLRNARKTAPDTAARYDQLAQRYGYAPRAVAHSADMLEGVAQAQDAAAETSDTPATRHWLSTPENAAVSHDVVPELSGIERSLKGLRAIPQLLAAPGASGAMQALHAIPGLGDQLDLAGANIAVGTLGATQALNENLKLGALPGADYAVRARQRLQAYVEAATPKSDNPVVSGAISGVQSFLQQAPAYAIAVVTRNPEIALGLSTGLVGGQEYGKARDAGKTPGNALTYAASQAAVEYATEKLPVGHLIGDLEKGTGLGKMILHQLATELPGEQVATAWQDLNEWAVLHPDKPFSDYLKARPNAALQTAVATVVGIGGNIALAKTTDAAASSFDRRAQASQAAQQQAEALGKLAKDVAGSKTLERAPERMQALIDAAAAGDEVFIPGEVMRTYLQAQTPEDAAAFVAQAGIGDQLAAEGISGADIVIPAGTYLTKVAPLAHEAFANDLRLGLDGESVNSAKAFEETAPKEAGKQGKALAKAVQATAEAQAPGDQVYSAAFDQFRAAGYTVDQARAQAVLWRERYETRAARFPTKYANALEAFTASGVSVQKVDGTGPDPVGRTLEQASWDDILRQQREVEGLKAAVRDPETGKVYTGYSHQAAINTVPKGEATGAWGRLQNEWDQETDNTGFVDKQGNFVTRSEAGKRWDVLTMEDARDFIRNRGSRTQFQPARGSITFGDGQALIRLFEGRNLSTLLHEGGHLWLEELQADAADPDAPEQLREDMDAARAWLGLQPGEALTVEAHEKFARGAEEYLREAKSPTRGMRGVFQRFGQWLGRIYKRAADLNAGISPEMRAVFERLLATDEAISAAQAQANLNPLFKDAKAGGMSEAEFAALTKAYGVADEQARAKLLAKVMGPLRRAQTAAYKAEYEAVYEEALADVDQQTDMRALRFIVDQKQTLSREAIVAILGADGPARMPRRSPAIYTAGGVHPDAVAQALDLSSGEALLRELEAYEVERLALVRKNEQARAGVGERGPATVREARAKQAAEETMRARHGDPLSDGSLEAQAMDAINASRRLSVESGNIRYLARMAGEQESRWSAAGLAAWADAQIAKRTATKVRPETYLRAERIAGGEALAAVTAGKPAQALEAQWRRVANMHLYRAAKDAQERADETLTLFTRIVSAKDEATAKTRNMDLVNAARAVLAGFGFSKAKNNPSAYMALIEKYDAETYAILAQEVAAATENAKDYDKLSVEELETLRGLVQQMWTLARRDKVVEIEGRQVEIAEVTAELGAELEATGPPKGAPPTKHEMSDREKLARDFDGAKAAITLVEEWARRKGPAFTRLIWGRVSKSADAYRADRSRIMPKLLDALDKVRALIDKPFKIDAPELGYTFGAARGGGIAELLGALRHAGNESNLRKLLLGRGWATQDENGVLNTTQWDAFIRRMHDEGRLTKAHWDYVQAEWDLHEEIKPLAQKAHRQLYGRYFAEVTANPVTTPFGTYRGGYVAAKVDPRLSTDAAMRVDEKELLGGNAGSFQFPTPANGFTKARVEYNAPLDLDIRLALSQMDEVLRFAHLGPAVRDVNRILKNKDFAALLGAYDPPAWEDMLLPWLRTSASQRTSSPTPGLAGRFFDGAISAVTRNTGAAIMLGSLTNTAQQITGFAPAMLRTGKRNMMGSLGAWMLNPKAMAAAAQAASPMMANRADNQMAAIEDAVNQITLNPNLYDKAVRFTRQHAYFMQHGMQNMMDPIVWTAAHSRAVELGEADPIAYADSVVRTTQGSNHAEDLTRFATGPAVAKPLKMFANFFMGQANIAHTEWVKAGSVGRKAEVYAMGIAIPAIVAKLISEGFKGNLGGDGDGDWWDEFLNIFVLSQLQYMLSMVPVVGQAGNIMINHFNDKPYDDKLSVSPVGSMVETSTNIGPDIVKLAQGTGDYSTTLRDLLAGASFSTGLPFSAIGRPAVYLTDIAEGDAEPTGPVDFARGLLTGTTSQASKQ